MPEATLSQIWHTSVKTCRLVETRRKILRFVGTRHHILCQARITTKNAAAEHFGSNVDQKSSKLNRILSNWHSIFPGYVFFRGKEMTCFQSTLLVSSSVFWPIKASRRGLQIWPSIWPRRHGLPDMAFQDGLQATTWTFKNIVF